MVAAILFYAGMLGMTLSARALHKAQLPHVRVLEIGYEIFTDKDGNSSFGAALPKELYQEGGLYIIVGKIINDEYRTVARRVTVLELGLENKDFYQMKNISVGAQIIVGGLDGVTDGCEVYIAGEGGEEDEE